jgi:hypothetical protein
MTLRDEHRLRVFENRVLRIFGPKRDEERGGWRKSHNEERHTVYSSRNIIRMIKSRMRWAVHVTCIVAKRNECRISVGKIVTKEPLC